MIAALCCLAPGLSGCIVGKAVGAAIDVTASAATAAVKVTGAAVETTVDVITPDGDDNEDEDEEDTSRDQDHETADGGAAHSVETDTSRIDRPRP